MTACIISPAELKTAIEPFEKIRRAVGDKIEIMVELHSLWNLPMAKKIAKWLEPYDPTWYEDPIRMNSPQALAELARSTAGVDLRQRDARQPFPVQGHAGPRRDERGDGRSVLDWRADRGAQDRRHGRHLSSPVRAA